MGAKLTRGEHLIINLMHQLDWTTGYANIWPNSILYESVRVFLDKITT